MNFNTKSIATTAAVLTASIFATGQLSAADHGHSDFLLGQQNGQFVVLQEHAGEIEIAHTMGAEMPDTYFTNAPGFNTEPDEYPVSITAPIASTDVVFDFVAVDIAGATANLFYWDGSGEASFTPVLDGTTFYATKQINPFESLTAIADGSANNVDGFAIGASDAQGGFHHHINFGMLDSNSSTANIADGIYAVALSLTQDSLIASEPVVIAFATEGIGEVAHEAAVEYLNTSLVPEPASMFLLGISGIALIGRRRK
ncbi:PEP-CTERM sorting domain-containing protein [Planctomycetota bacterium]|nr:PEP-CTERM sorting domain-containing protein [Planctomycetota bacterium]